MILQQLWADANAIMEQTGRGKLPPTMYLPKNISWIVELSHNLNIPVQFQQTVNDKKRGIERLAPSMKRSSKAIRPHLLGDKPPYTLGVLIADEKKDKGRDLQNDSVHIGKQHQAYKDMLRQCAEATGNIDVARIMTFLDDWKPETPSVTLPSGMSRDDWLTFRVDGRLPIEDQAVQDFWARAAAGEGAEETEEELEQSLPARSAMQCLVSGATGPVEEMMPVPIKGLLGSGAKSEMAIVSANANAFESYGLTRAQTSPISRLAGERFGQALNALLASDRHHVRGGNITYVFWARGGVVPLFVFSVDKVDPADLRKFMTAAWRGDTSWANGLPPTEKFQIFGLTPNAARVVVRSAIDTTIEEVGKQQASWFARLEIIGTDGLPGRPLPLRTLAVAAYREFKDIAPGVEDALVQAALVGTPLPESLLTTLVMRCRLDTDNRVTYPRAALLKYILTQNLPLEEAQHMTQEVTDVMPDGFTAREANAYHLGRLFCELENIQYVALNKPNTTISDRFYGAASTAPASAFGTLLSGVKNHLSKMRREGGKSAGNAKFAQKRLDLIMAWITDYPKTLTLREQALFGLGYYQYRAARRRDVSEASVAKQRAALFAAGDPDALVTDEDNE